MGEKETMSGEALRESPSKASTGQTTARESPTRASIGREASVPSVSERGVSGDPHEYQEGVTAPRDVATGQSSGKTTAGDDWPPGGPASGAVVGGAVPGGSILSAAVSSVGQLGGQTPGGGAASAAYARLDASGAEVPTGDLDGDGVPDAAAAIIRSKSNITNN